MIQGRITHLKALLSVEVLGANSKHLCVEAMVDTGFSGFLTLTKETIDSLGLVSAGKQWATLADGSQIELEDFSARVSWGGTLRDILISQAEGITLLGMDMLKGHQLTMDVQEGGSVRIKPID